MEHISWAILAQKQENAKDKVSLHFEMDVKGVSLLDDKQWSQTIKRGHDQMKSFLGNLPDKDKFWLR